MLRVALVALVFAIFASSLRPQHCEAQDHQSTRAEVEKPGVPASVVSASPSLPAPGPKAEQRDDEPWNYWDAIAPVTWNGWALFISAGIAAWMAIRTLSKINEQVKAEQTSVDLMRKEYAATHRPKIRIRNVAVELGEIDWANADKLCQTKIDFFVVNYGESEATLINAQYSIVINEQLSMLPYYQSEFMSKFNRAALASGDSVRIAVTGKQYPLFAVFRNNHPLSVIGYVDYKGVGGATYRTAFARHFDARNRYFVKVQNPDYEYEE